MSDTIWRVGIWSAVSSAQQAEPDRASLDDQEERGRQFAREINGHVVATYRVPGHSRSYVFFDEAARDMPAYRDLRADVEAGKLDVLHYYSVDRLGRKTSLAQTVLDMLDANGVIAHQAGTAFSTERQVGQRIVHAVQSVTAAQEIERFVQRHRIGMTRRTTRGLAAGNWPTGYTPIRRNGTIVGAELNEQAEAVREVTRLYLQGLPYSEIVRRMDAGGWRTPNGGPWYTALVRAWVFNDSYAGFPAWSDVDASEPSSLYPAIWDEDTYAAVLRERESRKPVSRRQTRGTPFLGIALCNRCGAHMIRRWCTRSYGRVAYLNCATQHRYTGGQVADAEPCHPNNIKEATIRDQVVEIIAGLVDLDALQSHLAQPKTDEREAEIARVRDRLGALLKERERLAEALAVGQMDIEIYAAVDGPKRDVMEQLEDRYAELSRVQQQVITPAARWQSVEELRELMTRDWDSIAPPRINALLRRIGLRVWVEEGEVVQVSYV